MKKKGAKKDLYTALWTFTLGNYSNTQATIWRLENQLFVPPGANEV